MWKRFWSIMNCICMTRYKVTVVLKNIVLFCNRNYSAHNCWQCFIWHLKHISDQYLEIFDMNFYRIIFIQKFINCWFFLSLWTIRQPFTWILLILLFNSLLWFIHISGQQPNWESKKDFRINLCWSRLI